MLRPDAREAPISTVVTDSGIVMESAGWRLGLGADRGDRARDDYGGQVGWSADLLTQAAEGVFRDLRNLPESRPCRSEPLGIEIQLISEDHSRVKFSLIYFVTTPKISSVAAMQCLKMTDVRLG